MKTLQERVLFLLARRGISQKQATERGGFKNTAFINDIVRGHKSGVSGKNLASLAKAFSTSEAFLLGQTDNPDTGSITKIEEHSFVLPEFDIRVGGSYRGGTDAIDSPKTNQNGESSVASWGLPKPFVESELGLSFGYADIIPIAGDSMDDGTRYALAPGDRVIIDRKSRDVRQGGIFAVFDGEGVIVKQVELARGVEKPTIICKSRNPHYDPVAIELNDKAYVIGRVAGKFSRM